MEPAPREGIGASHLQHGDIGDGVNHLRQALAIYRRIGTSAAQRVQDVIDGHGLRSITT